MSKRIYMVAILLLVSAIIGCNGGEMEEKQVVYDSFKDVPTDSWKKLAQKKIYFGHQSVGFNIMDGVMDVMKEHPDIKMNIVETSNSSKFNSGIFAHSTVGKNTQPTTKIDEFVKLIEDGIGKKGDIAALKLCYVDMRQKTDIDQVLTAYSDAMSRLKKKYQDVTIIHFTVPLTKIQTGLKAWIKQKLGKTLSGVNENIKRNIYNQKLISIYNGKEPIFDIAKIQSTFPDGKRSTFTQDGKTYYSMVPDYTYDGGHLNELGRKVVAEQFLIDLVNLP